MVISANKKILPLRSMLVLVAASSLLVLSLREPDPAGKGADGFQIVAWLIAGGSMLVALLGLVNYGRQILSPNAVFTISGHGIQDRLSLFSVGQVDWSDITTFRLITAYGVDLLLLEVKDPQAIINRGNLLQQWAQRGAWKRWGSPVVISQRTINYKLSELREVLVQAKGEMADSPANVLNPISLSVSAQQVNDLTPPLQLIDYQGLRMSFHDAHTLISEDAGAIIDWVSQDEQFPRDFYRLDTTFVGVALRDSTPDLIAINHYQREGTRGISVRVLLDFVGQQSDLRQLGRHYDAVHAAHYEDMWASISQQLQVLSQQQAIPPVIFVHAPDGQTKSYCRYR